MNLLQFWVFLVCIFVVSYKATILITLGTCKALNCNRCYCSYIAKPFKVKYAKVSVDKVNMQEFIVYDIVNCIHSVKFSIKVCDES